MNRFQAAAVFTAVCAATAVTPFSSFASSNYDLRERVVRLCGIASSIDTEDYVSRGHFAQMLVNASSYKSIYTGTSATTVYNDVPASHPYAAAIRIAADNGWMTAYLGGNFRPDEAITTQDAARGILALLGYTNEDFPGNQVNGRWAKYLYLDLGEEVEKEQQEILTKRDCVNLFYNLLCADNKDGRVYCTTLGYDVTADGEVNAMTIADDGLKGPKLVRKSEDISDHVPFDVNEATFYLNGDSVQLETVKQAKDEHGNGIVLYYNTSNKTVWAYSIFDESHDPFGIDGSKLAVKSEVTGIYYTGSDTMTPDYVTIDGYEEKFKLGSSDAQLAFSVYGGFKVGDKVVLVCEVTRDSDSNISSYTVIDYVED